MEACQTSSRNLPALLAGILPPEQCSKLPAGPLSGLHDDSRHVTSGSCFLAVPGASQDGRRFIPDAVARGAKVVVGQDLPDCGDALRVEVPDMRHAAALMASRWYGIEALLQDGRLQLVGITGTNGKTTTAYMFREILRAAKKTCALFGTIEYDLCGGIRLVSALTTPGPLALAEHLATAVQNGATHAVLEVSSHALSQQRVAGLQFAAVAWTNLTQDHLDYHNDLAGYAAAKARLFEYLTDDGAAILNRDDEQVHAAGQKSSIPVRWFGLQPGEGLHASGLRAQLGGTQFRMQLSSGTALPLTLALPGHHNVSNALAAAGLAEAIGVDPTAIAAGLTACRAVPGRVQRIPGIARVNVFVDFAHTPDALRHVGKTLRELTRGRLFIVFGCGGQRDRSKRPLMGQAALEHGHVAIVTSDNPRDEDPGDIIEDVMSGLDAGQRTRMMVEPDRRSAIRIALGGAQPGDTVLVAGKGHEDYQLVAGKRHPFDDGQVIREVAEQLGLLGEDAAT